MALLSRTRSSGWVFGRLVGCCWAGWRAQGLACCFPPSCCFLSGQDSRPGASGRLGGCEGRSHFSGTRLCSRPQGQSISLSLGAWAAGVVGSFQVMKSSLGEGGYWGVLLAECQALPSVLVCPPATKSPSRLPYSERPKFTCFLHFLRATGDPGSGGAGREPLCPTPLLTWCCESPWVARKGSCWEFWKGHQARGGGLRQAQTCYSDSLWPSGPGLSLFRLGVWALAGPLLGV